MPPKSPFYFVRFYIPFLSTYWGNTLHFYFSPKNYEFDYFKNHYPNRDFWDQQHILPIVSPRQDILQSLINLLYF